MAEPKYWKGFVHGLLTPIVAGVGLTLLATIVALVTRTKQVDSGGR